ncbi:MAG: hypothetical protein VKJ46_00615 [Leptolyngbyaceae bacterium]|nr:hypothetical protein [Leptolyngbyaceae bacterium]
MKQVSALKLKQSQFRNIVILLLLWLAAAAVDRIWFVLDHAEPAWDQSDHLTRALNYWRVLQHPQLFSGGWWTELWQQSTTYRAPLVYLATVPFLSLFGKGFDQAALVNLGFTAILLVVLYRLGKHLFTPQTGLWAAGLCLLAPSLVFSRTDYLLDYGLTAMVTGTFASLTQS